MANTNSPFVSSQDAINKALPIIKARLPFYSLYEDYYDGRHRIQYSTSKWVELFGHMFRQFADNLCPTVVDAFVDRLEVVGFDIKNVGEKDKDIDIHEQHASEIWEENNMPVVSDMLHSLAIRDGDAYAIVWPDRNTGEPTICVQQARLFYVEYDNEDLKTINWAVKAWVDDDKKCRVTFYSKYKIEKWVSPGQVVELPEKSSSLIPYNLLAGNTEDSSWPIENPYEQVPVFHFANGALSRCSGRSELHVVIPIQDALNASVINHLVGMEFVSLPQRWAIGMDVKLDENGKPIMPFTPGAEKLWFVPAPDAKFGQFDATDLTSLIATSAEFRTEIARISGIPLHYFIGMSDPPSGESLQALEKRVEKKSRRKQKTFGVVWAMLMRFAHMVKGHPDVAFKTIWADTASRSELVHAQTLQIKSLLGVPKDQLQKEMGYTEAQVEEFAQEQEQLDQTSEQEVVNSANPENPGENISKASRTPNQQTQSYTE